MPLDSVSRVRAICRDWNEDKGCRGPGVGWGSLVVGSSISGHNAPSQAGYTEYCQTFIHLWLTALKAKHTMYTNGREISAFAIAFSRSWTRLCVFILPQWWLSFHWDGWGPWPCQRGRQAPPSLFSQQFVQSCIHQIIINSFLIANQSGQNNPSICTVEIISVSMSLAVSRYCNK